MSGGLIPGVALDLWRAWLVTMIAASCLDKPARIVEKSARFKPLACEPDGLALCPRHNRETLLGKMLVEREGRVDVRRTHHTETGEVDEAELSTVGCDE